MSAQAGTTLRFTQPVDGDILNRHDGRQTPDGLTIEVSGVAPAGRTVTVNGVPASREAETFRATVTVTEFETELTARTGDQSATVKVYWDRNSYPRYRFSTDDNVWFLHDLADHQDEWHSIFDQFYLAFWREMHRRYGAKFQFNIYYHDDFRPGDFTLPKLSDKFKSEWQENADWLRLTFHAYANEPRDPYINCTYEEMAHDYRLVTDEIVRFAGAELVSPYTTVHWVESTVEGCRALRDNGVEGLVGIFIRGENGWRVSYYFTDEQAEHMSRRDYWRDTAERLWFLRHDIILNSFPLEQIRPRLDEIAEDPHQSEVIEMMIHEQYFWPDFRGHQPDAQDKVIAGREWLAERGYKAVWYEDGFLGATE